MLPLQSGGQSHGSVRHQRTSADALRALGAWSFSLLASGPSFGKPKEPDLSRPAEAPGPGRDHPGMVGDIISERVGGIIPERRAASPGNQRPWLRMWLSVTDSGAMADR